VHEAIQALGPPHDRIVELINSVEPTGPEKGDAPVEQPSSVVLERSVDGTLGQRPERLLEAFAQTAAELESTIPQGVSTVVYEALRLEVRPVAKYMGEMAALVDGLTHYFSRLDGGLQTERRERLDDVKLLVDLITTGWRSVDRRLGRIERMIERLERERQDGGRRY
jgi:hypothetical protein